MPCARLSIDGRTVKKGWGDSERDVLGGCLWANVGAGGTGKGRALALCCTQASSWGLSAFCGSLVSRTQLAAQDFGSQHLSDW